MPHQTRTHQPALLLSVISLLIAANLLTTASQAQSQHQGTRPNVILILTDDWEYQPTSLENMPNLQRLMVAEGMSFTNATAPISLCCPARVSILTGQYAHNHDIVKNTPPDGGFAKAWQQQVEATMFAPHLQAAGYYTALMGKYMNGYPLESNPTYIPPGWTEWHVSKGGVDYFNYNLIENGTEVHYGQNESDYLTDVLSSKAVAFLNRQPGHSKPFFLELSVYAPHKPAIAAPRHADLFPEQMAPRGPSFNEADVSDKPAMLQFPPLTESQIEEIDHFYRERLRSLQAVDDLIGELFATLTATGQLDNTYIFLTSDNGYHQGEHRIADGKQSPYEESINIPLIVVGPGIAAGVERTEVVSLIDLAPTFVELAALPSQAREAMDGRSLLPLLTAGEAPVAWRTAVLVEKIGNAKIPVDRSTLSLPDLNVPDDEASEVKIPLFNGEKIVGEVNLPRFALIRTERYSYIQYGREIAELYDLWADPYQINNLADNPPPDLTPLLQAKLQELALCAGAACRTADTFTLPTMPITTATPTQPAPPTATRLSTNTPQPTTTSTTTPTEPLTPTPLPATATLTPTVTPTGTRASAVPTITPTRRADPNTSYLPLVIQE